MSRHVIALASVAGAVACARPAPRPASPETPPPTGAAAVAPAPRPAVSPETVRRLADTLRTVLDRAVADGAFPGAYAAVGTRDGVVAEWSGGRLDAADGTQPSARTLWDLASLTKVVGTTSAMLQLVAERRVDLDAPVQRYLPAYTGRNKEKVTVRHLMTHSSGMPSWRPLYKETTSREMALMLVAATQLDTLPGVRYVYSDLNAILLGEIVQRVSGERIDAYLARHVFGPLGMKDTRYNPPASELARIAPTEFDPWRQRKLRGEVHDENAYAMDGVSGHAGLFSTGADLARLARAYLSGGTLDGHRVFDAATLARFVEVQDTTVSRRALGWETPTGGNSAGHRMSARAFGHTGFTGTSLWIDPERGVFVLLLTNRVNPTRQNLKIGSVRVAVADAVMSALGSSVATSATAPSTPSSTAPRP